MDLLDLIVKITADDQASGVIGKVSGGIKTALGAAATAAGAAVAAVTTGVVTIGKSALEAYASYEQLVGGVDKLFGAASGQLQAYAAQAYKTSGMSANQYMEQATSFSASLISSLGGDVQQAANLSDLAMRSMADNVNVFGSNMTDVQNAFQGFAKQNYTMLDNLKLGYGGTQAEMQRLVKDASQMDDAMSALGVTVDGSSMSFDNIVKAIAVVQQNMGIMGTTSREAAGTIEGSVNQMKAAWDNWLVGLADPNLDLSEMTTQLVESIGDVATNVIPRISEVASGIVEALPAVFSTISTVLAPVIQEALAAAWNIASSTLGDMLGIQLPQIDASDIQTTFDNIATAVGDAKDKLVEIAPVITAAATAFGVLKTAATIADTINGVKTAMEAFKSAQEASTVAQAALNAVMNTNPFVLIATVILSLVTAFATLMLTNEDFRNAVTTAWTAIQETASAVFGAIVEFFTVTIPGAIQTVITFFSELPTNISTFLTGVITAVATWVTEMVTNAATVGSQFLTNVVTFFSQLPYNIGFLLGNVITSVVTWVAQMIQNAVQAGSQFLTNVVNFITQLPGNIATFLSNVISNVVSWVGQMASNAASAGSQFLNNVINFITSLPGRVASFLSDTISRAASFVSDFAAKATQAASDFKDNIVNGVKSIPSRMASIGGDIVRGLWNGIKGLGSWLSSQVSGFFSGIVDGAKSALGIGSPSKVFRDEVGKWIPEGIAVGIQRTSDAPLESIEDMMSGLTDKAVSTPVFGGYANGKATIDDLVYAVNGLHSDLGRIISSYTPVMTRREFSRAVRSV